MSIIDNRHLVILAIDAPLSGLSLRHLAKRAAIGIGRGDTPSGNNLGHIFLASSTANEGLMPQLAPPNLTRQELNIERLNPLFMAAVQAIEEAMVNALVAGKDVETVKPSGRICHALEIQCLREIF